MFTRRFIQITNDNPESASTRGHVPDGLFWPKNSTSDPEPHNGEETVLSVTYPHAPQVRYSFDEG